MRLREILNIIRTNYKALENLERKALPAVGYDTINNYQNIKNAIENLGEIEIFKKKVANILSEEFEGILLNSIKIESNKAVKFLNKVNLFKNEIILLKDVLENLLNVQDELTLSIKLYEFNNFKDFSNFCNNFNKKVLAPLGRLQEDVAIGDFEIGSRWINIVFQTTLGLALVTHIFRASFDILIHDYEKYRIVHAMVERYEKDNAKLDSFNKFLLEDKDKLFYEKTEEIIQNLKENHELTIKDEDLNEFKTSIKLSMEESHKLLDKGLEIYQALDVPAEKRYQLPDYKELVPFLLEKKLLTKETK